MKVLLLLILIAIGVGAYYFVADSRQRESIKESAQKAKDDLSEGAHKVKDVVQDKLGKFSLNKEDIRQELEKTGKVVREKAKELGDKVADVTADARITSSIKAKLVADSELSALSISVSTSDGVVTLSGSVPSHEQIGKAMLIALETDGVKQVISTIQVKQSKE